MSLTDGFRESEQSWKEVLLDLKHRGLTIDPKLAVGEGHWVSGKRCRKCLGRPAYSAAGVHKNANVLNKLPKHLQAKAKSDLHQIWMAHTRENARLAFDLFVQTYRPNTRRWLSA